MYYRRAREEDLPALKVLGLLSYGELRPHLTDENWLKMQSAITSDQTFPLLIRDTQSLVCAGDGGLVGMAFLVPSGNPTKIYTGDTCYIRMVGVHPDAGGKGIGQTLVSLCIERAKENGEKKISLHSAEVMYAARHIYEKLGFEKIGLLDEHYGLQYWLYSMNLS